MKNLSFPLLAFLALALLTLSSRPAQADWVLDHYDCSGTYSINGVSTPWPTPTQSVSFYYGGSASLQCSGTVQAFFKWTGTGPAPSRLNVLITSSAAAYGTGPNPDDGFHDSIVVAYSRTSAGSHVVQVPNPNNNTLVSVPTYNLSAITTGGISVSFQASVVNAVLQGYSTHISPALTQVEQIDPSVWDPSNPRYFSGTGCEARGTAVPITGYVSHVQLCINDMVVQEYWDNAAPGKPNSLPTDGSVITGTNLMSATVKVLFDSTHFADVSTITIKLKVTDTNSGYYEVMVAGPVKNRLYGIANQNLKIGNLATGTFVANQTLDDVVSTAQQMNYTAVESITDDKAAVLNTIPSYTAFFAFTHGEIGVGSCTATEGDASQFLRPTDIQNQLAVKAANLNLPPYNFVELDACSLGKGDGYIGNFGITSTLSGKPISPVDRAGIAWADVIAADVNNEGWSETLWENLSEGRTLYDATIITGIDWTVLAENPNFPSVGSPFPLKTAAVSIFGDPKMTLHGVYGKPASPIVSSSTWYRSL